MQMLIQHPYPELCLTIPVLMGLALIGNGTSIDIQWHVNYIVLVIWHLAKEVHFFAHA